MVKHQSNSYTPVNATCSCTYHFLSHPSSAIGYFFRTEGALLRTGVSIDPNKTKWSRQVRKLILDSDSEILDFWSFDEKKNGEIYMHTYAYSANSAFSENQRWLLSTRGMRSATIVDTSPCHIASKSSKQAYILTTFWLTNWLTTWLNELNRTQINPSQPRCHMLWGGEVVLADYWLQISQIHNIQFRWYQTFMLNNNC